MPLDLEDESHVKRFRAAVDSSVRKMKPFREKRMELMRQFVGHHYPHGATDRVPYNLIHLLGRVYSRKLAPAIPKACVKAKHRELRADAYNLSLAIDYAANHLIKFGETWSEAILDAIFGMAVVKVGLAGEQFIEFEGDRIPYGTVYVAPVYLEDYVHDMGAKRDHAVRFQGDRYRYSLEALKNDPRFNQSVTQDLAAPETAARSEDEDSNYLSAGDEDQSDDDEIEPMVDLWDFWLPREKVIVTMLGDKGGSVLANKLPLRVQNWTGHPDGPYPKMRFGKVSGNTLPCPPGFQIADQHDLVNRLYRKLGRQAENQRDVMTYRAGAKKDAETIHNSVDQSTIPVEDPNSLRAISLGGINQQNLSFAMHVADFAKAHAGNLDILAGMGPQTETLGQDQMLGQAASELLDEMAEESTRFATAVYSQIGFYLKNDPLIELPLVKRVPGTNIDLEVQFAPADTGGEFLDYNFEILPYSIRSDTPTQKLQRIERILDKYIIPGQDYLQQQGITVLYEVLIRTFADYLGVPELEHMLMYYGQPQDAPRRPVTPGKSAAPPTQDRRVGAGMTNRGFSQVLQQKLLSGGTSNADGPVRIQGGTK